MSKNKNCHEIIIDLEADGFRRKNIQAVANSLFCHLKFTTINVCNLNKKFLIKFLMTKININKIPEDPAFSTGGRLIFKCIYLCILVSNNLV
jgi:hypothetical protein